jgi:hypothetical protein
MLTTCRLLIQYYDAYQVGNRRVDITQPAAVSPPAVIVAL